MTVESFTLLLFQVHVYVYSTGFFSVDTFRYSGLPLTFSKRFLSDRLLSTERVRLRRVGDYARGKSRMELKSEDYHVWYDASTQTLICQGALRLADSEEYDPIWQMLNDVVDQQPSYLTLDLRSLKYLNSSGFNVLLRFVLRVRQEGGIQMLIRASKKITWQEKSLKNLQRIMPSMQLELN